MCNTTFELVISEQVLSYLIYKVNADVVVNVLQNMSQAVVQIAQFLGKVLTENQVLRVLLLSDGKQIGKLHPTTPITSKLLYYWPDKQLKTSTKL